MYQWSVNARQRKAPLRGAWVRYCAPDARSAGGHPELWAPTIRGLTEDYRADNRVINNLSHTFSTPGNNPIKMG